MTKRKEKEKKKEKGCVEPMYGKKAKGVIKIIPKDVKCKSITIHSSCLKKQYSYYIVDELNNIFLNILFNKNLKIYSLFIFIKCQTKKSMNFQRIYRNY